MQRKIFKREITIRQSEPLIAFQDLETYKNTTKEEVMTWITSLKKCGSPHDWMVVLVENPDSRKGTNKLLPRTSVVDKLRADLGTKYADKCLTLTGKKNVPD